MVPAPPSTPRRSRRISLFIIAVLFISIFPPTPVQGVEYSTDTYLNQVDAWFNGEHQYRRFAESLVDAGDVNGDGYDDFMIGAPDAVADPYGQRGEVYIFFGGTRTWTKNMDPSTADASYWGYGYSSEEYLGETLAAAGDVNGDGFDDILIGSPQHDDWRDSIGSVYLILGRASGWGQMVAITNANASFLGEKERDYAGSSIAGLGDINDDGYDDFIIGARGNDETANNAGQAYIIYGKPSGWQMGVVLDNNNANASFTGGSNAALGSAAIGPGDLNGDGIPDIVLGANGYGSGKGRTYVIYGKKTGWTMDTPISTADASFSGENMLDSSGSTLATGDVNGDGYKDIIIGAPKNGDAESYAGKVYVEFGNSTGWTGNMSLANANATFLGENEDDRAGTSLAAVGDVNGDWFDDIVIGAPYYDDGLNGSAGKVYLVLGRATNWSMDMNLSNADSSFIGNANGCQAGFAVGGGGDYNLDGFKDILVGAPRYGGMFSKMGKAYLIYSQRNWKPTTITSVKAYSDDQYTEQVTVSNLDEEIYVELLGTDARSTHIDLSLVNITSSVTSPDGFLLWLVETDVNTGMYRGSFRIDEKTNQALRWIGVSDGETVTVTSVQDPSKKATFSVDIRISLRPRVDNTSATEDMAYSSHYWAKCGIASNWVFDTNADWLSWGSGNHTIYGTPDNGDVGSAWVRVNVTSTVGDKTEHNFTLDVANVPPVITTALNTTSYEDTAFLSDLNSTDDGQGTVTWHLKTDASWLLIDPVTGVLNGTPSNDDVGQYWVNVSVDDGNGGWDWRNSTLTVINTNDAPDITTEDVTKAYQDTWYNVHYSAIDVDAGDQQTLGWALKTNASFLTMNSVIANLTGTPKNWDIGSYWVNVTVKDKNKAIDFHNFTLEVVNANDPPEWVDVPDNSSIDLEQAYIYDVNASDIDISDVLRYNISSIPSSSISIDTVTGLINWSPEKAGVYDITVTVTDGAAELEHRFTLTVVSQFKVVLVYPSDGQWLELRNPILNWTIEGSGNHNFTYEVYSGEDQAAVSALDPVTRKGIVEKTYFQMDTLELGGVYYWTVIPVKGKYHGECLSGVWHYIIDLKATINQPPEFNSTPILEAKVGQRWTYTPFAKDQNKDDVITIRFVKGPEGMTYIAGRLEWTPTAQQVGVFEVVLEATDGVAVTVQQFNITVRDKNPLNHGPTLSSVTSISIKEGELALVKVLATDADGDTLDFIMTNGPQESTVNETGLFKWQTQKGDAGIHQVAISVSDGEATVTAFFNVTVKKVGVGGEQGLDLMSTVGPIVIIAVIAAIIVAFLFLKRKKVTPENGPSMEAGSQEMPPPLPLDTKQHFPPEGTPMERRPEDGQAETMVQEYGTSEQTPDGHYEQATSEMQTENENEDPYMQY